LSKNFFSSTLPALPACPAGAPKFNFEDKQQRFTKEKKEE
jgi:hypothetical protein